jgi:DNA polymerase IIIc chi subunit
MHIEEISFKEISKIDLMESLIEERIEGKKKKIYQKGTRLLIHSQSCMNQRQQQQLGYKFWKRTRDLYTNKKPTQVINI